MLRRVLRCYDYSTNFLLSQSVCSVRRSCYSIFFTEDNSMFNRTKEIEILTKVLLSAPQLSIVTGPVNSGKTRLVEKVLSDLPSKSRRPAPVYSFNLRKGSFHSVHSLVDSLSTGVGSWISQIKGTMDSVSIGAGNIFLLRLSLTKGDNLNAVDHLNHLLVKVASDIPSRTVLTGTRVPVFIIDEANRLRTLLRDKEGQAALESLFKWFILHTKEKGRFHVLLVSSDSFFNLWVEKFVGSTRYNTYVLGHLDREEAEMYWNTQILEKNKGKIGDIPKFEDVFTICGGSMFLMDMFAKEYWELPGNGMIHKDVSNFSLILQEERRLKAALRDPTKNLGELEPPAWTNEQLIEVMTMLVKDTILDYDTMCKKLGDKIIKSFVEYNIMHLRPTCRMAFDVPHHSQPILTAESPSTYISMRKVLTSMKSQDH